MLTLENQCRGRRSNIPRGRHDLRNRRTRTALGKRWQPLHARGEVFILVSGGSFGILNHRREELLFGRREDLLRW
jgi:hypothetical protein